MDANFGTSTPYSLGIEEEFQLVDLESFELVSRVEPILATVADETIRERVEPELLQSAWRSRRGSPSPSRRPWTRWPISANG